MIIIESSSYFYLVSPVEIEKLYDRFVRLDRDRSGTLSENELLCIPELAMNPFASRLVSIFQETQQRQKDHLSYHHLHQHKVSSLAGEIDFRTFVVSLSPFSSRAPLVEKLKCKLLQLPFK